MAIQTSNLGYPRIGLQREWKKTLEAFWSNNHAGRLAGARAAALSGE